MRSPFLLLLTATGLALAVPVELLENGDFESGVLSPWTTNSWTISTTEPHWGAYCAFVEGNYWIRQDFTPVDVSKVVSVTFWHRQPEVALFGIEFYYGQSDYDFDIIHAQGPDWSEYDATYLLRPAGNLEAVRIWGYSGGGPDPDYNYLDDVSIMYDEDLSLDQATFGTIKALFAAD
ncbi:hypothetical protein JW921_03885 [Candidatus Fermentibacterales bacterium]|nr:hypothetical protein [Candidatus Fermentibacterales bacterium]